MIFIEIDGLCLVIFMGEKRLVAGHNGCVGHKLGQSSYVAHIMGSWS
jgi:hypothetical protein